MALYPPLPVVLQVPPLLLVLGPVPKPHPEVRVHALDDKKRGQNVPTLVKKQKEKSNWGGGGGKPKGEWRQGREREPDDQTD